MRHPTLEQILDLPPGTLAGLAPARPTAEVDGPLRARLAGVLDGCTVPVDVDDVRIRRAEAATRRLSVTWTLARTGRDGYRQSQVFYEAFGDEVAELRIDAPSPVTTVALRGHFNDPAVQQVLFGIFDDPAMAEPVAAWSLAHATDRLECHGDDLAALLLGATADVVAAASAVRVLSGAGPGSLPALAGDWDGTVGQLLTTAARLDADTDAP